LDSNVGEAPELKTLNSRHSGASEARARNPYAASVVVSKTGRRLL
jgi:hypothetical protein